MERDLHSPGAYDFRQYDRVWQRVRPTLAPYPDFPPPASPAMAELPPADLPEDQLPGAQPNPCCMGSAAEEMLDVLTGFIEEELADRRYFLAAVRQAPSWARQRLREMAAAEGGHARRLLAAYYLITGTCYQPAVSRERIRLDGWCAALRERYHLAACNALNYARAADSTTDPCLTRLFNELSAEETCHADQLMSMLERSLQN